MMRGTAERKWCEGQQRERGERESRRKVVRETAERKWSRDIRRKMVRGKAEGKW